MTATFFFAALCPFSALTALHPEGRKGKALFIVFCALLLASVLLEARVFLLAGPAREARERDEAAGKVTVESFAYPETDKYFFPSYDIREIGLFDTKWRSLVPWNKASEMPIPQQGDVRAFVSSNIVFLENLPQGAVHAHFAPHIVQQAVQRRHNVVFFRKQPAHVKQQRNDPAPAGFCFAFVQNISDFGIHRDRTVVQNLCRQRRQGARHYLPGNLSESEPTPCCPQSWACEWG
jgi:hypothetical protein